MLNNRLIYLLLVIFTILFQSCSIRPAKDTLSGIWESEDTSVAKIIIRFDKDTMQMYHDFSEGTNPDADQLVLSLEKRNPMSFFNYTVKGDSILYTYQRLPNVLEVKDEARFFYTIEKLTGSKMVLSENGNLIHFKRSK